MEIPLVLWLLLLFGVSLNLGHYIREPENGNSVYSVKDGSSDLTFVSPKEDKRTLREILYYHIIERPREEPANTERSFTNGHSYRFLEPELSWASPEYDEKENEGSYQEPAEETNEYQDTENRDEEPELTTTQKPLTDDDVKEAYKQRSYLFDQLRQRYPVKRMAIPESLDRRKREAEIEPVPDTADVSSDPKDAYIQPKTYGMNLNGDGGYVWNNLNNPPTYYELGGSNGSPNEGSQGSSGSQETPSPSEPYSPYIPPTTETSNSGSSEDIYIVTNRPSAVPIEIENSEPVNENPEPVNEYPGIINENPGPINENPQLRNENAPINDPEASGSGAGYPVEPIINADSNDKESNEGFTDPIGPEVYEKPAVENGPIESPAESEAPLETPINEGPIEEVNENPGYGYGQPEVSQPQSGPEESSDGEPIKYMPEAPTLPPLNYDNLPDYVRQSISTTEQQPSYVQTENPYSNPQTSSDEGILVTMQPVEDIPHTYGMNLSSDGGRVWNDMVNPPVSYDVGSPQPEQEHNKEQPQPATDESEYEEHPIPDPAENPIPETAVNPIPEPAKNPMPEPAENPIPEPAKNPIPEPAENPIPEPSENPIPEPAKNPIPEPAENPIPEPSENPIPEPAENPIPQPAENPISRPAEEPIANPEEPHQETHEEDIKPVEEPSAESEEPIATPNEEVIRPTEQIESLDPELPPGSEENHETEESEQPGAAETSDEIGDHPEEQEIEPANKNAEENEKPDIMNELLKSEQFWKWLGEWTETYMELLEKHIRKIAIQEICNRQKSGEQMCLLEDKLEDTGIIVKDGKIIIDGKEIDVTNTDNLNKDLSLGDLKKRPQHNHINHSNDKDENKKGSGNKIEASTIYGNAVGNEHVTNVFIFTADKADEVIEQLKPANETDVDFIIDDRIKEDNKDESNKEEPLEGETSVEDLEANKKEEETPQEKPIESEANKEEQSNEEANKDDLDEGAAVTANLDKNEENKSETDKKGEEELIKDSEQTSGDIEEDAVEESKQEESSEKPNESKDFLENK